MREQLKAKSSIATLTERSWYMEHFIRYAHEELLCTRKQVFPGVAREVLQPGGPGRGQVEDEARGGHAGGSHQRRHKTQKHVV